MIDVNNLPRFNQATIGTIRQRASSEDSMPINPMRIQASSGPAIPASVFEPDASTICPIKRSANVDLED